jgi:hypothetical protein
MVPTHAQRRGGEERRRESKRSTEKLASRAVSTYT